MSSLHARAWAGRIRLQRSRPREYGQVARIPIAQRPSSQTKHKRKVTQTKHKRKVLFVSGRNANENTFRFEAISASKRKVFSFAFLSRSKRKVRTFCFAEQTKSQKRGDRRKTPDLKPATHSVWSRGSRRRVCAPGVRRNKRQRDCDATNERTAVHSSDAVSAHDADRPPGSAWVGRSYVACFRIRI